MSYQTAVYKSSQNLRAGDLVHIQSENIPMPQPPARFVDHAGANESTMNTDNNTTTTDGSPALAVDACSDLKHWQRVGLLASWASKGQFNDVSKSDAANAYAHGEDVFIRAGTRAAWRVFKNTLIHDAENVVFCLRPNNKMSNSDPS